MHINENTKKRYELIQSASIISLVGNAILAVGKIFVGLITNSLAVVGDGIDSSTDVVISIITLITSKIIAEPSDKEHPYGHSRAETISTILLAFIIFFAGAQLLLSTIHDITDAKVRELPGTLAIIITIVSICGKIILALSQFIIGKKTQSSMLIANGKNMRNDIIMSCGVLVGLILTFALNLPIADRFVAVLISFWIFKTAIEIFLETNRELMDGVDDNSIYSQIFAAVKEVKGAGNPHRARVRKLASFYVLDMDIEVPGNMTVYDAHKIAQAVETSIRTKIDNIYDVVIHIEPEGNAEDECFGLNEATIKNDE